MTARIKLQSWFQDSDGLPTIYKNRDANLFYEITYTIQGTSFTSDPAWTSDGATISNDSFLLTGKTLVMTIQIKDSGRATVKFTDNLGNEEELIFKWLADDADRRKKDYRGGRC